MGALQCHKRLWYEVHQPDQSDLINQTQQRIIDQGNEVGHHARERFPYGQLIEASGAQALQFTQDVIAAGVDCLFEAAFAFDGIFVRCDILQRNRDNTWDLIEVKSSTSVKDEHLWDVAIQLYVLTGSDFEIQRVQLMHVNSQDCAYPDLSNLFVLQEITAFLNPLVNQVATHAEQFRQILAIDTAPERPIGDHCQNPNPCPFQAACWHHVPEASIFTIPRLNRKKKAALIDQGILAIADLPPILKLSAQQKAYVETVLNAQPMIDVAAITARLAELSYPIHFFDFETLNPAIPRFEGMRPYEHFPFQYSCHVLTKDGQLEHHDYLQTDAIDPRLPLIQALITHIGPVGSVVVYHKSFEASRLKKLAESYPQYRELLMSICDRLWDQEDIFKHHYQHPKFLGKTSIKKVLPVVAPALNYGALEIQRGDQAQAVWDEMIRTADPSRRRQIIADLRAYCKLDTQAMVAIHQMLVRMSHEPETL